MIHDSNSFDRQTLESAETSNALDTDRISIFELQRLDDGGLGTLAKAASGIKARLGAFFLDGEDPLDIIEVDCWVCELAADCEEEAQRRRARYAGRQAIRRGIRFDAQRVYSPVWHENVAATGIGVQA